MGRYRTEKLVSTPKVPKLAPWLLQHLNYSGVSLESLLEAPLVEVVAAVSRCSLSTSAGLLIPKKSVEIRATITVTENPEMGTRRCDIVVADFWADPATRVAMVEFASEKLIEEFVHPSIDVGSDWKSSDWSAVETMNKQSACPTINPRRADFPLM